MDAVRGPSQMALVSVQTPGDLVNLVTLQSVDSLVTVEAVETNIIKLEQGRRTYIYDPLALFTNILILVI